VSAGEPVDVIVNPGNTAQRYILWGNGRIDAVGGAPSATIIPEWFDRLDQPVGVAIWITNWTTGAGYVLDCQGGFQQVNGAAALGSGTGGVDVTALGVPYFTNGGLGGHLYVDWSWDPGGSGRAVVLDKYGQFYYFQGPTTAPRSGKRWTYPVAKKLAVHWTSGNPDQAITLDAAGGLHADYAAVRDNSGPYWVGWDAARDLAVTSWGSPVAGYVLDLYGAPQSFGGAASAYGGPYKVGSDSARCLAVISASNPLDLFEVWSRGQQFEWVASTAPTVNAGGGVSDVQKVTITGSPTGGTFKLVFGGQTTATIAYNATAATVQTALQALTSIGAGNATVTGGPGPGAPWTVTFTGTLANTNVAQMTTSTLAFTGGTSPTVTVITLTNGVDASPPATVTTTTRPTLTWGYADAQKDDQAAWQLYVYLSSYATANSITDPTLAAYAGNVIVYVSGTDASRRGVVAAFDFSNGTYKYFIRAADTSGKWSAWSSRTWTQNVPAPATPSGLTATAHNATYSVSLSVNCTTGGSADTVAFGFSDDGGVTWGLVRGAEAVPLIATTLATDWDAPLGITRLYRAVTYNDAPRVVSVASATASATLTDRKYVLTSVGNPALGGEVFVKDAPSFSREAKAGVFEGLESEFPVVVSDGVPKSRRETISVECDSRAAWDAVNALINSDSTLVYRNPFGEVVYCRIVGTVTRTQQWKRPYPTEVTPLRHNHLVKIPLVEISEPLVLDISSSVPPGPQPIT
jgi:hypothetical protein